MGVLLMLARAGVTQHARNYSRIVTLLREKPVDREVKVNVSKLCVLLVMMMVMVRY